MNKTTIKERIETESMVEPVEIDKSNGTQSFEDSRTEKLTAPVVIEGAATLDNADPTAQVYVDYVETSVVVREKRIIDERLQADGFKTILEDYKRKSPAKYEAKKEELERKAADARKAK